MQKALRFKTTVQPGGKIEILSPELQVGQMVAIIVMPSTPTPRRSAIDILEEAPGQRLFKTAKEVDNYIEEERASWDR